MSFLFSKMRSKGEGGGGSSESSHQRSTLSSVDKDGGGGDDQPRGYRTHLIFAGKRDPEAERRRVVSTAPGHLFGGGGSRAPTYSSSFSNHPFSTQPPLNDTWERPGQYKQGERGELAGSVPFPERGGMLEVVAGISRDCFIIPLACVDRFLPAGLALPDLTKPRGKGGGGGALSPLNVLEVADPHESVVIHLMTPLLPLAPSADSPLSQPERVQRNLGEQLMEKTAAERIATHGLLLSSLENNTDFPMIALYRVPRARADPNTFLEHSRRSALDTFEPSSTGHCGDHFFHLCREVATIARPGHGTGPFLQNDSGPKRSGRFGRSGYIISIFRVFDGDDKEKLERNWLYWTGARTLYRSLPKSAGLRRITLHKSVAARGDKLYLLMCECANFLDNVNTAAQMLPALRARLCGYTGIYRVAGGF